MHKDSHYSFQNMLLRVGETSELLGYLLSVPFCVREAENVGAVFACQAVSFALEIVVDELVALGCLSLLLLEVGAYFDAKFTDQLLDLLYGLGTLNHQQDRVTSSEFHVK